MSININPFKSIDVSADEHEVIRIMRHVERNAYNHGFENGGLDAMNKAEASIKKRLKDAYNEGKAKAYREIQIAQFMEETDNLMWVPGNTPEEDGEYLVSIADMSTPIAISFAGGTWQIPSSFDHEIVAYRKMPKKYEGR